MKHVNKKAKSILSLCLAAVILTSTLAGCSSDPQKDSTTGNPSSTATDTSTASKDSGASNTPKVSDNFNPTGLPILKEPDTFKAIISQQSTKVAAKDKECVIQTAKDTNVNFEITEIPEANMKEKVGIMFASGDLPDVFLSDIDVATQWEQLAPIDELITAFAPNVVKLFEDRPEYKQILKAPDGKIHFLPGGDEAYMNQLDRQQWINQVWLDKLNLKVPTTTDELYTVLKAFKDNDPNGNGKKDEIPFSFYGITDWATGLGNMFGSFGTLDGPGHVYVKEGKVIFAPEEQAYYDAMVYFNKLFKEGLIDPEAFTQSLEQYNAKGKGKDVFGSVIGYRANSVLGLEQKENFAGVLPLKGANGSQMTMANYINQLTGFQITTACKQPEALVRYYDYVNSSTEMALLWGRGKENINYKWVDVNGEKRIVPNLTTDPNSPTPIERGDLSFSGQTPALWMLHRDEAIAVADPDDKSVDRKRELITASMPFAVYGMPAGLDTVDNTQRKALLLTDIDTYMKKFTADSIMNGIDDAKWQKHLKALEDLKKTEYVDLCQQFIDR